MSPLTAAPVTSPWFRDWRVARLLHAAISHGATLQTELERYPAEDRIGDEWMLAIDYGTQAEVEVVYTAERGFWVLTVDTFEISSLAQPDLDDVTAAAFAISAAAKLVRDLNALDRRARRPDQSALGDEIVALIADRGLSPAEAAARLGMTYASFASRASGSTMWSATDLLRIARTIDDGSGDTLGRLLDAVEVLR